MPAIPAILLVGKKREMREVNEGRRKGGEREEKGRRKGGEIKE